MEQPDLDSQPEVSLRTTVDNQSQPPGGDCRRETNRRSEDHDTTRRGRSVSLPLRASAGVPGSSDPRPRLDQGPESEAVPPLLRTPPPNQRFLKPSTLPSPTSRASDHTLESASDLSQDTSSQSSIIAHSADLDFPPTNWLSVSHLK